MATFKEEVLTLSPCFGLCVIMQEGSPFLRFLHSAAVYFDMSVAQEYRNKVIAFIGDKTEFGMPTPVILPQ